VVGSPVPPSVKAHSFSCPRCGALAHQTWYQCFAKRLEKDALPNLLSAEDAEERIKLMESGGAGGRADWEKFFRRLATGEPFFYFRSDHELINADLENVWVSRCYSCNRESLWIYDSVAWPALRQGPAPNPDLTPDISRDFEEARSIIPLSPRGAAALARLCIQKLCVQLKEPGKNLNDDIGNLVRKGLDARIQQALDVVRVVGNNAVHPGQIDLKDDHDTAMKLLGLVNLIADAMISQPKHVAAMFDSLPDGAKAQVAQRDGSSAQKTS
jgi:hypothetical protein